MSPLALKCPVCGEVAAEYEPTRWTCLVCKSAFIYEEPDDGPGGSPATGHTRTTQQYGLEMTFGEPTWRPVASLLLWLVGTALPISFFLLPGHVDGWPEAVFWGLLVIALLSFGLILGLQGWREARRRSYRSKPIAILATLLNAISLAIWTALLGFLIFVIALFSNFQVGFICPYMIPGLS